MLSLIAFAFSTATAQAGGLQPIGLRTGCSHGRTFAHRFGSNHPRSISVILTDDCYRRDAFRIVFKFTAYRSNLDICTYRGTVTASNGSFHWRQYEISCS